MAYKTSNIIIKCRPEEKEKVKEKAQKENMTLSEYIRKKIFFFVEKQMERSWKNFRIDKNKVYKFIGKMVVYLTIYAGMSGMLIYGLMNITVYR